MSSEKGELPTWYALDHAPSDKGEANPTPGPHGPQLEPGDAQNIVLGAALLTQTAPPKPEPKQDEIPEDEVPKPKSEVWTEIGSDSNCFSPPGDTSQPVPAPTAIAYVPAPHPGEEATPNRYPELVPLQKETKRDSDTNPAPASAPANTPTSTQSQQRSQAPPSNPPQRSGTLSEIMLSGSTLGVAGVAAGISVRGLALGVACGTSAALLTGFAQESWDKLSAKGRAVTAGLGSLTTALYFSDDLSLSKLGVAGATSTVVGAGVGTVSKIKEK